MEFFTTVYFQGIEYRLTNEAYIYSTTQNHTQFKNTVLEFHANALDENDKEVKVIWLFDDVENWEIDDYNFSVASRVERHGRLINN